MNLCSQALTGLNLSTERLVRFGKQSASRPDLAFGLVRFIFTQQTLTQQLLSQTEPYNQNSHLQDTTITVATMTRLHLYYLYIQASPAFTRDPSRIV